jgi:hypothetical protein
MHGMRSNLIWRCTAGVASAVALGAAVFVPLTAGATTVPKHVTTVPKHVGTHAGPMTTPTLAGIQAEAAAAVTARTKTLDKAVAATGAAKHLGDGGDALSAYLGADLQPLIQQGRTVAADSTVTQAQQDYTDIFTGFRVYHLVLPAARLAARADRITQTDVPALTAAAAKAQTAVNSHKQTAVEARRTAKVEPLLEDLNGQIGSATSATQGLASTVLAYTPAQWNADYSLLSTASSSLSTAEHAIRRARDDVVQIRQDLHGVVHGGRPQRPHHDHR